jgi:hypothetical protein
LPVDTSRGPVLTPTITISDVDKLQHHEEGEDGHAAPTPRPAIKKEVIPGAIPEIPLPDIPDWYRIGWRAVTGIDDIHSAEEEVDKGVLAAFLKEQYYGEWYHNAGVIFIVSLDK